MATTIEDRIEKTEMLITKALAQLEAFETKMNAKKMAVKVYTKRLKELQKEKTKALPKLTRILKSPKVVSIRRGRPKKVAQA